MAISGGFDPTEILTAKMSLSPSAYPKAESSLSVYRQAVERVGRIPGVLAVSGEALILMAAGVACGLTCAVVLSGTLRGLVYGVATIDPITLFFVAGLVGCVGLVAAGQPAWQASRLDPTAALRSE